MPPVLNQPIAPGTGPGWSRLATALRQALPPEEVDGVWVFRTLRTGPKEFGTAIVSRVSGERRRIYTARYALDIKGRQRGAFDWGMDEVGSGPLEALDELLALVPARGVEEEPPAPIDPLLWFPPPEPAEPAEADESPAAE